MYSMHHQGHETTEVGGDHFRSTGVKLWLAVWGQVTCDTALERKGRIHNNLVADGQAGAVMQKPLENKNNVTDGQTDIPTELPTDMARCKKMTNFNACNPNWLLHIPSLSPNFFQRDYFNFLDACYATFHPATDRHD